MQQSSGSNVRFGSKADIAASPTNVRFTPKSGHGSAPALNVRFVPKADMGFVVEFTESQVFHFYCQPLNG
jgi:hypothetical protein